MEEKLDGGPKDQNDAGSVSKEDAGVGFNQDRPYLYTALGALLAALGISGWTRRLVLLADKKIT